MGRISNHLERFSLGITLISLFFSLLIGCHVNPRLQGGGSTEKRDSEVRYVWYQPMEDKDPRPSFNGTVLTSVATANRIYVGGNFSHFGPRFSGALFTSDPQSPSPLSNLNYSVKGEVHASVSDDQGGFYIAGFYSVGGGDRTYQLSHVGSDGNVDKTMNLGLEPNELDEYVGVLTKLGSRLYLGGSFYNIANHSNLVALDLNSNAFLPVDFGIGGDVNALIGGLNNKIFLGGFFERVGVKNTGGGLVVNKNNSFIPSTFPQIAGEVYASLSDNSGGFYIGGWFRQVGHQKIFNLAHILADGSVDPHFSLKFSSAFSRVQEGEWDSDCWVNALALEGTKLYVGGEFSKVEGQSRSNLVAINTTDLSVDPLFKPVFDKEIHALAHSGSALYVGGDFQTVDTHPIKFLVALNTQSGLVDTNFNFSIDGQWVWGLTVAHSKLYLGGQFWGVQGQTRENIAAIDLNTQNDDESLDSSFTPAVVGSLGVKTIVVSDSLVNPIVYIGGLFGTVNSQIRKNVAALYAANGVLVDSFNPVTDGDVSALALRGGVLYLGGSFNTVNGASHPYLASLNTNNGSLRDELSINLDSDIETLSVSGDNLFVGGYFLSAGGEIRRALILADSTTGQADVNFNPQVEVTSGYVWPWVGCLVLANSKLYLGGHFNSVDGQSRNYLGRVDASSGALDVDFNPIIANPNTTPFVYRMVLSGSSLYLAGGFTQVGGQPKDYLAAVNPETGGLIDSFSPVITTSYPDSAGPIKSMALSNSRLYIGGVFESVDGQPQRYLAALDPTSGRWDTQFDPVFDAGVYNLSASPSQLYVGGKFSTIGGQSQNNLAALWVSTGELDPQFTGAVDGTVSALTLANSKLYVGGSFQNVGGIAQAHLAAVDPISGALDTQFVPTVDRQVSSLLGSPNKLYIGGQFSMVGGVIRPYLAAIDLNTGALLSGFDAAVYPIWSFGDVKTMALSSDDTLYVGGAFSKLGNYQRNYLGAVDGTTGAAKSTFSPNVNYGVSALTLSDSKIYIGGDFTTVGGLNQKYLSAVNSTDGSVVTAFNPSVNERVTALLLKGSDLYFGGWFTDVEGQNQKYLAAVNSTNGDLSSNFRPELDDGVSTINSTIDRLFIGGYFWKTGEKMTKSFSFINPLTGASP